MIKFGFGLIVFGLMLTVLTKNGVPALAAVVVAFLLGAFGARD